MGMVVTNLNGMPETDSSWSGELSGGGFMSFEACKRGSRPAVKRSAQ